MIGKTIRRGGLHYEIIKKLGEVRLVPQSGTADTSYLHFKGVKL